MRGRGIVQGLLALLLSTLVSTTPSASVTFNNGIKYKFDTDGNAIDSTSGKIDFLGGEYVSRFYHLLEIKHPSQNSERNYALCLSDCVAYL